MTKTGQDIPTADGDKAIAGDTIVIEDSVDASDGTAKDISGMDISFALADYPGDTPIVTKTDADGGTEITDGTGGTLQVTLDPSDTESLGSPEGQDFHYEIELTDDVEGVSTVTEGTITLHADTA